MVSSAFLNVSKVNPYLYSGKETERMNGLNEYDFAARWYDHAVPGFTTPDPLAEKRPNESPYAFCGGNPVNRSDQTGQEWYWSDDGGDPVWIDGDQDVEGYDNHNTNAYKQGGEEDNYQWTHYVSPDSGSQNSGAVSNQALTDLWNYNQEQGGNNNIAPDRSAQMGDVGGGQNQDDRLSKLPAAAGMTVDVANTVNSAVKLATPVGEIVLRKILTRPTTIAGAVLTMGPAIIEGIQKGNWTPVRRSV